MDIDTIGMNLQGGGAQEQQFDVAAREIIEKAIREGEIPAPGGEVLVWDSVGIEGEAMLTYRRGKRIPHFDYKVNLPFRIELRCGQLATGMIEVPEFTNAYGDVDEDLDVKVFCVNHYHCTEEIAADLHKALEQKTTPLIREALVTCAAHIYKAGMNPPAPKG
mmetsp:Transcript_91061/g.167183  ORF Transcript_91061/g.167183 Transcript_91061/m.167183 type:complete len:163 (+) Transcript_91061:74-562(+)